MKSLHELGIRVPQEVSLIGFSNSLISQVTNPTLTTIDQHGYQIGQTSIQLLLDRIMRNHGEQPFIHQVIKTDLIVRESTKKSFR
ncbi:MAG: substrate-binding domain-containing protein, partial [Bacteroidales bacterium]|nr:substrate-binding domain-containing protein [Bacteroidales bacterium]